MRRVALITMCACGPVTGELADTGTSSSTQGSLTDPVSITANSTVPPQSEVSSLEVGSYDAVSFEEGPVDDGIKLDMFVSSCPQVFDAYPVPSAVAVLVDASQTMVTQLVDHDGDAATPEITRWAMASSAVVEHFPALFERSLVSVQSFPSVFAAAPPEVAACVMDEVHPPFGSGIDQLSQYLPPSDATFMLGATPTATALAYAHTEIAALGSGGRGHIVVITDGAPNCALDAVAPELFEQVDARAYDEVTAAFGDDIEVHVIGVDVPTGTVGGGPEGDAITDHRAALAGLAQAGGTAAIFVEDATVLDLALDAIVGEAESCRLVEPFALGGVWYHVIIDGDRYYYELPPELCEGNSGWYRIALADGVQVIQMCGAGCDSLRLHGAAQFEEECAIPE